MSSPPTQTMRDASRLLGVSGRTIVRTAKRAMNQLGAHHSVIVAAIKVKSDDVRRRVYERTSIVRDARVGEAEVTRQ